jgi:Icc-related predicted phosphoesterase
MRIVAISDTHGLHENLVIPDGDILIHAGDLTREGSFSDVREMERLFAGLPHSHKLVIAGNHDFCFEQMPERCREIMPSVTYLQDQAVKIGGLRFYGSPWTPWFHSWAFNLQRGFPIRKKWLAIPRDTDILITHGPPLGIGDLTLEGEQTGCEDLREIIDLIQPRLHIFGHIHEGAGVYREGQTTFVNASSVNRSYQPVHAPIVIDLDE